MPRNVKINDHTKEFLDFARNEVEMAVAGSAIRVAEEATRLLGLKPGPSKQNPTATASKPGEPPHKRTSVLADSIQHETLRRRNEFTGRVGTNVKYGFWLEIGTKGGTVIKPKKGGLLSWIGPDGKRRYAKSVTMKPLAPRPYLRPALNKNRKKIVKAIRAAGKRMEKFTPKGPGRGGN